MLTSSAASKVLAAYLEVQKNVVKLKADKYNDAEQFKYISLDAILDFLRPICNEQGLILTSEPFEEVSAENAQIVWVKVRTILTHAETGQDITFTETAMPLESHTMKDAGTAITRCRKYALSCIFGLTSDNDFDGQEDRMPQCHGRQSAADGQDSADGLQENIAPVKKELLDID